VPCLARSFGAHCTKRTARTTKYHVPILDKMRAELYIVVDNNGTSTSTGSKMERRKEWLLIKRPWMNFGFFVPMLAALLLVIAVSCGGSAASTTAPAAAPAATTAPAAVPAATPVPAAAPAATTAPAAVPAATPVPAAAPAATTAPAMETKIVPSGHLRIANTEMGPYKADPCTTGSPTKQYITQAAFETLLRRGSDGEYKGIILKDWSIASDNRTWTFNINKGVQFHGGLGELTAEDIMFSADQMTCEGAINGLFYYWDRIFKNPDGYMQALDNYTIEVDTVVPLWDVPIWLSGPGINGGWIVQKSQTEELVESLGMEEATRQLVGTGPWELVEDKTSVSWNFKAVEDHYRKTPFFAELTFYEITEESTRIANFQTDKIDTFVTSPDTISILADIPGVKFMSQEGIGEMHIGLYGQYYIDVGTEDQRASYKPDKLPYVSTNSDITSDEWERARKVREAMSISIDREKIIEELLHGEGKPLSMWGWMGSQDKAPAHWKWEYDVERAKQLLKEAGYADGFEVTLTTAIAGVAVEEQACQAVGDMWADIGITAKYQNIPYSALRPQFGTYSYEGAACQASTGYSEPMGTYSWLWNPAYTWSGGFEHPYMQPAMNLVNDTFDADERFAKTVELGEWMWENTLDIGLYEQNNVYPLGPHLDSWEEHLSRSDARNISGLEWAPHRK